MDAMHYKTDRNDVRGIAQILHHMWIPLQGARRFAQSRPHSRAHAQWQPVPLGIRAPGRSMVVGVLGSLTLDHPGLMVEAAADGLGITYVPVREAQVWLDDGRLVDALTDWYPSIPGLFLYYPGSRLVPAGLRASIEVLRQQMPDYATSLQSCAGASASESRFFASEQRQISACGNTGWGGMGCVA
ncbi:LysR substrate-binding domain-containing protein [Variovorax ginsengisoli]|uniref:DNA-binding transcriptional LysR family regulator n=1 Tax=Variovorax ginsengisoli TaxID=363844 RepID=A0ABT9SF47_9BURK|nr:LysR substrate-binding domain-containing protein [Variovorax ginsengisoli]MDP9902386.1 DNA-binding transcriptional LysR family regulator [Variovorax ginsengisoli]